MILILFLMGILLFCYDYYLNFNGNHFLGIDELRVKVSLFIIILVSIYFSLHKEFKQKQNNLVIGTIVVILILFTLNINQSLKYYKHYRIEKIMSEYKNIDCEMMKGKFAIDLKNNELKLFISGGLYNLKFEEKYNIEIFNNGSYDNLIGVGENRNCYNNLVENYYLKELKINIQAELYKTEIPYLK